MPTKRNAPTAKKLKTVRLSDGTVVNVFVVDKRARRRRTTTKRSK